MRQKIGVIFGGKSVEHEISIISALQAMENIDRNKYDVLPIYISKDNRFYSDESLLSMDTFKDLSKATNPAFDVYLEKGENNVLVKKSRGNIFKKNIVGEVDIFFLIVHGTNVEDGTLSGFVNLFDIPVIGPSVLSGAVGQDKAVMKDILKANNINQTKYIWAYDTEDYSEINNRIKQEIGYPVIIKPANLGSSVGIEVVMEESMLETKLDECFSYDQKVVIEEYLTDFRELNISLRGSYKNIEVSPIEEVRKQDEILSYENKYMQDGKNKSSGMASLARQIPADLDKEIEEEIKRISTEAFKVLNVEGIIRIDFMLANNQVYLNEVNNIPGSLSFYLWQEAGIAYSELINQLIEQGINDFFSKKQKVQSIDTNVLNFKGNKNGK